MTGRACVCVRVYVCVCVYCVVNSVTKPMQATMFDITTLVC